MRAPVHGDLVRQVAVWLPAVVASVLAAGCTGHGRAARPQPPVITTAPQPAPPPREKCVSCSEATGLDTTSLSLVTTPRQGGQLRYEGVLRAAEFAEANPLLDDVMVALRDTKGEVFCAIVRHQYWTKKHRNYRFQDRGGRRSGGLASATLTIRRDGTAVLHLVSARLDLPRPSGPLTITVRVGERCAAGQMEIRQEGAHRFVFP
jgi:hypothetical protein